jgi:glucose-6-phosphate-specific signal transduction histidine kinase
LKEDGGRIILEVQDDGRGISTTEISNPRSMGLLGMRERAGLLGGDFKIGRIPGHAGTRVTVSLPFKRPDENTAENNENSFSRRSRRSTAWVEADSRR